MSEHSFPDGFLWGVAGAGHQTEGDNTTSDTWFAEHVTPTVFMEPSGKACDSYRLWREDVELAAAMGLTAYRFSVVVGDDPSVRDRKRAEVYERWLELARDDDFIGVQNYERIPYDGGGPVPPPPGAELNQMGSVIEPLSLGGAVRYAHEITGRPVLVTEHGMSTADDRHRAEFIEPSLAGLLDAIEDGVPVLGYCHWTLLDNFEWVFGYGHQLGLHEVDRQTFERTPKPSAGVYAALVNAHTVRG